MNIEEAAIAFVEAHKPSKINVDWIERDYGSVAKYLEMENPNGVGDSGSQYMEISKFDSLSGHTEIIEWYAHEAFQIAYYTVPESERRTPEDHMVEYIFDPDFDWTIGEALRLQKQRNVFDLNVTEFRDGSPHDEINLWEYTEEAL